jgi:hypothetical protein
LLLGTLKFIIVLIKSLHWALFWTSHETQFL